jgi:hypothetical protein
LQSSDKAGSAVSTKGDLVDHADDIGDFVGGLFDPAHRFDGLSDNLTGVVALALASPATLRASSARLEEEARLVVVVISSSAAAVCSKAAACCSVRLARSFALWAISLDPLSMPTVEPAACGRAGRPQY